MIVGVAAAALVVVAASSLLQQSKPKCVEGNPHDYVEGRCPVNFTSVPTPSSGADIKIHVWLKAEDLMKNPKIEIEGANNRSKELIYPFTQKRRTRDGKRKGQKISYVKCRTHAAAGRKTTKKPHFDLWELVHRVQAAEGRAVSLSYVTASTNCRVNYTRGARDVDRRGSAETIPVFRLEVNRLSKSFKVKLDVAEYPVRTKWCYSNGDECFENTSFPVLTTARNSQPDVLRFPFLLPCVCVEVYYNYNDATRRRVCPFQRGFVADATDVWLSSTPTLYSDYLQLELQCNASDFNISASLCWRQHDHLCTSTPETGLAGEEAGQLLKYNTSAVDQHPLMCVQFSLGGGHTVHCPFQADFSSWEVYLVPGAQSVSLHLTSAAPATFSAQLCVLEERRCTPVGEIHSVAVVEKTADGKMKVLVSALAQKPCVQVWRSSPPLIGRRILCPDYAHKRHGLYAVATVMFVFIAAIVAISFHRLTKRGTAGSLCIQKPALLVCSSEQSAHVSAVCALASILQGELSATVRTALWALKSQTQDGAQAGVADLGPLPWLYGQWEAVSKEQGKVLIVWSSEAKKTYEKWKEGREKPTKTEMRHDNDSETNLERGKLRENVAECSQRKGKRQKDGIESCEDFQREPCAVITPVFQAALACLEAALQKRKGERVALVYFHRFCHNRDIPKAFRGIPRYCLPQDFRGLLQELGAKPRPEQEGGFSYHRLPRLLSKILFVWLARRLARKLQTLLPQVQGEKKPKVTSSQKQTLGKTQNGLRLPPTDDTGTSQEHEPLRGSPSTAEEISAQVSCV